MIRKSHFLLALALALAAAAIGVPVAQAAVKSPYEYLGHPTSQGGADRVSAAAVSAAAVKSPYEYLGHPTSQGGVDRVSAAAVSAAAVKSPYEYLGHPTTSQGGVDRVSPQVAGSTVFQWGDAGIGAGFAFGIVLLVGGAGAGLLISRRNGRQQAARA